MFFDEKIDIEGKSIGKGHPVFIIAEAGVNHNGRLSTAKEMIARAAECGVDCVKFQTFRAREFMADRTVVYSYEVKGRAVSETMYDMFKRLELPLDVHEELFDYCRERSVAPLTSTADVESADYVESIGVGALKLSSEDFVNYPLLEHVFQKSLPLILSTGMADEQEIDFVRDLLERYQKKNSVFLHCVSLYPTPDNEVRLLRMKALQSRMGGPVGYSDHTVGIEAALSAVALGACVIEKHFTLDKNMTGPDHWFSADPVELKTLVNRIRKTETMMGSLTVAPSDAELRIRREFRRSIVAARDLPAGHEIQKEDLVLKRPGTGLNAREMPNLIGKTTRSNISKDLRISHEMLE